MVRAGGGNLTGEASSYPVWENCIKSTPLIQNTSFKTKRRGKSNGKQEETQIKKENKFTVSFTAYQCQCCWN